MRAAAAGATTVLDPPATSVDELEQIPTGPDRPVVHLYLGRGTRRLDATAMCGARCTQDELDADLRQARPCLVCARIAEDRYGVDFVAYVREVAGR